MHARRIQLFLQTSTATNFTQKHTILFHLDDIMVSHPCCLMVQPATFVTSPLPSPYRSQCCRHTVLSTAPWTWRDALAMSKSIPFFVPQPAEVFPQILSLVPPLISFMSSFKCDPGAFLTAIFKLSTLSTHLNLLMPLFCFLFSAAQISPSNNIQYVF